MRSGPALFAGCALFLGSFASAVEAQDESMQQTAAARALFAEGVELIAAEQWREAADRFERSLALRDSAVVAYNLASALVRLERFVEASEHLQRVVRDEEAPVQAREAAEQLLGDVEPRLGRLTITLNGDTEGIEIVLDDRPVPGAVVGVAIPADPGTRTVVVKREGAIVAQGAVIVPEGRGVALRLEVPPPPEPEPEPAPEPEARDGFRPGSALRESLPEGQPHEPVTAVPDPGEVARRDAERRRPREPRRDRPPEDPSLLRNPWFWVGVGAGVLVAAITGTIVALALLDQPPEGIGGNLDPPVIEFGQ